MSRRLHVVRTQALTTSEQIEAVFTHRALYELAALVPDRPASGRPPAHPPWAVLAYGVLARVFRSGARTEIELAAPGTWDRIRDLAAAMAGEHPDLHIPPAGARPPRWDAWKHARNAHLADPDTLEQLRETFMRLAVGQARAMGLLDPSGPGSWCHPDRTRTVYGDGTVIRPLYAPPAATRTTDKKTGTVTITYRDAKGKTIGKPARRFDPDAADHHGHTGPVHGQNFVGLYARGARPHQRIVLAVDRVPAPGAEADTAVALLAKLHGVVGAGMQAVVYDGALRGVHHDTLMTTCGVIVVNKVHASARTAARKGRTGRGPRWYTLGTWTHDTPAGECSHTLAAVDGAVSEVGLDDAGQPLALHTLVRRQVKRSRRATGRYHFNVAYDIPCPRGDFLAWVTPHDAPGEVDHRRADAVRVIAEGEPDFARLYPIRSDAESFNSQLKRTLLVDRAMSLGGARQLLDFLCYGLLHNAVTDYRARTAAARDDAPPVWLAA